MILSVYKDPSMDHLAVISHKHPLLLNKSKKFDKDKSTPKRKIIHN